jgi:hypothetical protein
MRWNVIFLGATLRSLTSTLFPHRTAGIAIEDVRGSGVAGMSEPVAAGAPSGAGVAAGAAGCLNQL